VNLDFSNRNTFSDKLHQPFQPFIPDYLIQRLVVGHYQNKIAFAVFSYTLPVRQPVPKRFNPQCLCFFTMAASSNAFLMLLALGISYFLWLFIPKGYFSSDMIFL
jgi:hypothetical protein